MQCKWDKCSNESRTRSQFCSETCSKRHRRNSDKPGQIEPEVGQNDASNPDKPNPDNEVGQNPDKMAIRTNPDNINYGTHMSAGELKQAGLTANRVPIPGDADYTGVCVKVGDKWEVGHE